MKKIKLLATILVVAIMTMGAGYAIWTDSVEIEGNVETGHMNITIQDNVEVKQDGVVVDDVIIDNEKEVATAEIKLTELVPGGSAEFKFTFENQGNIDVKAKEINLDASLGELDEYLDIDFDIIENDLISANNGTLEWSLAIKLNDVEGEDNNITQEQTGTFKISPQFVQAFGQ